MGPTGAIIMSFFGAVFALVAFEPSLGWHHPILLLPPIVFVTVLVCALIIMRRPDTIQPRPQRAGKIIKWATVGEGAGIFAVISLLVILGRSDLLVPGIALIVGLHFLPMAYATPFRPFYALAAVILVAALAGFAVRRPLGSEVAGATAAIALWAASLAALHRGVTMPRQAIET